jgi:hypothetical protein
MEGRGSRYIVCTAFLAALRTTHQENALCCALKFAGRQSFAILAEGWEFFAHLDAGPAIASDHTTSWASAGVEHEFP